jgi:hypothetical protein
MFCFIGNGKKKKEYIIIHLTLREGKEGKKATLSYFSYNGKSLCSNCQFRGTSISLIQVQVAVVVKHANEMKKRECISPFVFMKYRQIILSIYKLCVFKECIRVINFFRRNALAFLFSTSVLGFPIVLHIFNQYLYKYTDN